MTVDEIRALHDRGVAMFSREQVAVLLDALAQSQTDPVLLTFAEEIEQAMLGGEHFGAFYSADAVSDADREEAIALYAAPPPAASAPKDAPVCDKDPRGCWNVRCQLGKVCVKAAPPPAPSQPRLVARLTVDEIAAAHPGYIDAGDATYVFSFARAVERAVLRANGLEVGE